MEVTTVKEYVAKQRKMVKLPSGFVFEIRKMSPLTFTKMFELIGVRPNETEEETEKKVQEGLQGILELVIPVCVVRPRIVLGPAGKDELSLDDLDMDDFLALLDEITEFSGLDKKSVEERESFRKE